MANATIGAIESPDTFVIVGRTRMILGMPLLYAACRLTARVGEIENANAGAPFGDFWEEILESSMSVAVLSVACIEAYANELFFEDAALSPILKPHAAAILGDLVDRKPALRKFSVALEMLTDTKLDLGRTETQNAALLVDLRDAIIHFRSEWSGQKGKHEKLSKDLLGAKVMPSPFLLSEPLFPLAWASHNTCRWALRSTVDFLDYFYPLAGLPHPLRECAKRLSQLSAGAL